MVLRFPGHPVSGPAGARAPGEERGVTVTISGPWVLHFSWGCTDDYGRVGLVFDPDGTFSGGGFSGAWRQRDGTLLLRFADGPAPVGYDPRIIPQWSDGPTSDQFAALRLTPYRLRVMPGTVMTAAAGEVLNWRA